MFSDRTNWKLARNRPTEALEEVRAAGRKILDLTVSNPTRVGLRYDKEAILSALASFRAMDYDPQPKGLLFAREAIADYYRVQHGVTRFDAERLILTTSTSEGYSFVFRLLCNAGDELLVPKPSYPLFEFLADLQDVRLVPYPLIYDHGWQMDFPSLEQALTPRTRGVVVVHPNNPTGSYVSRQEREQLNRFCRERGLAVVVDEVFLDYGSDSDHVGADALVRPVERSSTATRLQQWEPQGLKPTIEAGLDRSAKSAAPPKGDSFVGTREVLTFALSGLSKISALPQMKVAWIAVSGPEHQAEQAMARLEVIADTYLSMNAPIQWAVPALLGQRHAIQKQLMERVRANLVELDRRLAAQKVCSRLEVEGGWYAVLRVPVTQSDEELAIALLREKSVLVHPGHFYDFASDGYLVVSLIGNEEEFSEGVSKVFEHLRL
jgi:alanine-synthesizing transaminase